MVKLTFSVDEATAQTLKKTAERLRKPQSMVVREAVASMPPGRLTDAERRQMLKAVDTMMAQTPTRPQSEVARELRTIRRARCQGGRRHVAE